MTDEVCTPKVLLVDDQPAGLVAIEAILRSPDYELVTARSGKEALGHLLAGEFALILMDVRMPGLDGFETAAIIKTHEKSRDIPIIFITGVSSDSFYELKGYQSGAVDYLFKPFDASILRSKVAVFIDLFKKNQVVKRQAEVIRENELAQLELENLKRYRVLADAIPHMVWEARSNGVLSYLNKSWCDYTGLSREQSSGTAWQAMVNPEDLPGLLEAWASARKTNKSFETECRIKRGRDGAYRWHLVLMVPETNHAGQVNSWLGTATDIHDRKQVEEEVRKASQAAQEAMQAKSDFLATVSHEIRTPMNSILGMTGLLLEAGLTQDQREFAEVIRQSGSALLTLINDILDFSKMESGKLKLEIIDFNLEELMHDCEKIFSAPSQNKGIQYHAEIQSGMHTCFKGDSGRIQQVLMNLINNAVKFTSNGSVTVRVSETNGRVRFEVHDTGIGIPESAMSRMFQRFSQADSSTTRRFGGTGLGLSICKLLVDLMGGEIGVKSEEGHGSLFWFEVDLEKAAISETKRECDRPAPGERKVKTARILVAEDNTANQKVALRALEKMGYRAEVVGDGNEVLDALREIPYDLVLMDWQMPEVDGCKATRMIRESKTLSNPRVPIIAMTANAMKDDQGKCLEAGMDDYISKPVDFGLLEQKIDKWLSRGRGPERPEVLDHAALEKMYELDWDDDDGSRPSILDEYLETFYATVSGRFEAMKAAARTHNSKALYREAHTLKSNSAYLGAIRMLELCKRIEEQSEALTTEDALSLIGDLENECAIARRALDQVQIERREKRKA